MYYVNFVPYFLFSSLHSYNITSICILSILCLTIRTYKKHISKDCFNMCVLCKGYVYLVVRRACSVVTVSKQVRLNGKCKISSYKHRKCAAIFSIIHIMQNHRAQVFIEK